MKKIQLLVFWGVLFGNWSWEGAAVYSVAQFSIWK